MNTVTAKIPISKERRVLNAFRLCPFLKLVLGVFVKTDNKKAKESL